MTSCMCGGKYLDKNICSDGDKSLRSDPIIRTSNSFSYKKIYRKAKFMSAPSTSSSSSDAERRISKILKYMLLSGCALIAISYTIVFLASYPGYYCYDCEWFWKFIESGYISSFQSPLQTLIVSTILQIGYLITNNWNSAIAIYTVLHMLIMIAFSMWILYKVCKLGAPMVLIILAILFFALNPLIAMFAVCSAKDTIFSMLVLVMVIKIYEFYRFIENGKSLQSKATTTTNTKEPCTDTLDSEHTKIIYSKRQLKHIVYTYCLPIFIAGLIAALYRKNFLYVVILFFIIMLIVNRRHLKVNMRNLFYNTLMITLACLIVLAAIIKFPVYSILGIESDDSLVEGNCVFAAQVARVASIDDELYQYLKVNARDVDLAIERYKDNPENTDGYRYLVVNENSNVGVFAKAWWMAFSKHPWECIEAFGRLTMAAWLPGHLITAYNDHLQVDFNYPESKTSLFNCWTEEPGFSVPILPELQNWLYQISRYGILESNLLTAWLVSPAVYVWLFIACLIFVCTKRNKASIVAMLLVVCLILSNLMGPCVLVRYYLYLMYGWPIFVAMCVIAYKRRKECSLSKQ